MTVRVRFAPSPTGELHIGGVRTALFNWLFARNQGGKMILRIDDTDLQRSKEKYLQSILDSMEWLGLDWDEGPRKGGQFGPYHQIQRLDLYQHEVNKLLEGGNAYHCFCTPEELARQKKQDAQRGLPPRYRGTCRYLTEKEVEERKKDGQSFVIRLKVPQEGETVVEDLVRNRVTFENKIFDDFIIVKSDGIPTYNLASTLDDARMEITHVIRAEEHLSNTPRQVIICKILGLDTPIYAHVPMILAPDHSKLSKRHGATSVQEYRDMGILPDALINYLALLGWSPGGDKEIMPLEEMISLFSLDKVSKNASIYDLKKLTWLNSHYLRTKEKAVAGKMAVPFLKEKGIVSEVGSEDEQRYLDEVVDLVREKVKTLQEVADAAIYFFREDFPYDEADVAKHFSREDIVPVLEKIAGVLGEVEPFQKETIKAALKTLGSSLKLKLSKINLPIRLAITGRTMGPDLLDVMALLGRDRVVERVKRAKQFCLDGKNEELI
ncbi:MAG TPA: glutamate--tRNA ligase [Firmicutes bacterium]|jgi:glutamyl-tRNA synthetase|nr:glutamate--tRNA ligase [Bacillota bacterium]